MIYKKEYEKHFLTIDKEKQVLKNKDENILIEGDNIIKVPETDMYIVKDKGKSFLYNAENNVKVNSSEISLLNNYVAIKKGEEYELGYITEGKIKYLEQKFKNIEPTSSLYYMKVSVTEGDMIKKGIINTGNKVEKLFVLPMKFQDVEYIRSINDKPFFLIKVNSRFGIADDKAIKVKPIYKFSEKAYKQFNMNFENEILSEFKKHKKEIGEIEKEIVKETSKKRGRPKKAEKLVL